MRLIFFNIVFFLLSVLQAQVTHYPLKQATQVIWGQGFGENALVRLPATAQATIPADVWNNSQRSSGLQVRFKTNATSVIVNYTLAGKYSNNSWYSDMGANGLDLYMRKPDTGWVWCSPEKRTIGESFTYSRIDPDEPQYSLTGYEYCLYLPPFANTKSLSVTVNEGALFEFIPVPADTKPIVVYGTSIVHGAVCSRPGNIWTNILSRRMPGSQVVNLGFSGTGRMEEEVVRVINQIDAGVYIIDCLPNMCSADLLPQIISRCKSAVGILRNAHPDAKVLLTEHPGYADEDMFLTRRLQVLEANNNLRRAYNDLVASGDGNIFYLSRSDLDLDMAFDLGDYIHPNDEGMYKYACALQRKLEAITGQIVPEDDPADFVSVLTLNTSNALSSGRYSILNLNALIRNCNPDLLALQDVDFGTTDIGGKDLVTELAYHATVNGQPRQGIFTPIVKRNGGEKGLGLIRRDCFEGTERILLDNGLVLHTMDYTLKPGCKIVFATCRLDPVDPVTMLAQAKTLARYAENARTPTLIAADIQSGIDSETMEILETKLRRSCKFNNGNTYPAGAPVSRYSYLLTPLHQNWVTASVEIVGDESASKHKGIFARIGIK